MGDSIVAVLKLGELIVDGVLSVYGRLRGSEDDADDRRSADDPDSSQ
ncbi:hypothetical protein RBH26_08500 [Natronolimnohabitans sp. A-GB9]|nr:hypothetical protein [Natronolimnohabitans sp. A-GB9]MDQ2050526.1 hypothetical protein [Natronolimnohabitans sp. A-GB9]